MSWGPEGSEPAKRWGGAVLGAEKQNSEAWSLRKAGDGGGRPNEADLLGAPGCAQRLGAFLYSTITLNKLTVKVEFKYLL